MIKAVIFDLDGTLLDRDNSLRHFIHDQYDRMPFLHVVRKQVYVDRFIELDSRGYVWKDKVYTSLLAEFGIGDVSPDELLTDYINNFRFHCVPFVNLHETLEFLKSSGFRLAMITNGFGEFQLANVRSLGIEKYFDFIMVSELEGIKKPDPEIFIRALKRFEMDANEAVYVGDHPKNDIQASRNIGMKGIWKMDPYFNEDFERDGTIKELIELKDIL
ncbi:HAD family hydrolase [Paenibacillus puerhi]|uniref:HAD family hydrolase n=1 Tax=Paenibacillus puerhi TaxID=2692622 RepID=UPI00135B4892|nr:HAD-IA family hydrolase [Paenibacillus puerhi]